MIAGLGPGPQAQDAGASLCLAPPSCIPCAFFCLHCFPPSLHHPIAWTATSVDRCVLAERRGASPASPCISKFTQSAAVRCFCMVALVKLRGSASSFVGSAAARWARRRRRRCWMRPTRSPLHPRAFSRSAPTPISIQMLALASSGAGRGVNSAQRPKSRAPAPQPQSAARSAPRYGLTAPQAGRTRHRHCQQPTRGPWAAAASTGGDDPPAGNGGGGSGGSSDDDTGSGGGGGEGPNLGSNVWMLVVAAAAALGLFNVGSKRLQLRRQLGQAGLQRLQAPERTGSRWASAFAAEQVAEAVLPLNGATMLLSGDPTTCLSPPLTPAAALPLQQPPPAAATMWPRSPASLRSCSANWSKCDRGWMSWKRRQAFLEVAAQRPLTPRWLAAMVAAGGPRGWR